MRFQLALHAALAPIAAFARPSTSPASSQSSQSLSPRGDSVWVTPHDSYSSSIGVLGCKINTDRVAYWPQAVDCTNLCVSLEYGDRQVYLLRIDQSQGAYDVSYDAWNYLYTGESATKKPTAGGAVEMKYRPVDASKCAGLIRTKDNRLPLSAANSMNFLASCLDQSKSWVAKHYVLYNILDSICTLGSDEKCNLDWPAANQASCPSTLGVPATLKDTKVYNIRYPTGEKVLAGSGAPAKGGDEDSAASLVALPHGALLWAASILTIFYFAIY